MVPRKLELKNFLSYGEQPQSIDFTQHSLICLSGKNGNGKSALLDAITWAVWGQARKVAAAVKPDEGLLRLGQTKMMVCLEFDLNQSIYRIRREFAKTHGKPFLAIDFEVYSDAKGKFLPLTEKTVRQTQEKIETTLGLDYETFINSAFLRQGQSNEFSKKSPRDRKMIFASILGLSKYDKLQQGALEKTRQFSEEKRMLLHAEEQACAELAKEQDVVALRSDLCKGVEQLKVSTSDLQVLLSKNQLEQSKLSERKREFNLVQQEIKLAQSKDIQKINELRQIVDQWRYINARSLSLPDINKLEKQKQELVAMEKGFLELRQNSFKLKDGIIKKRESYQKRYALLESGFEKKLNEYKLAFERNDFAVGQNKKLLDKKAQEIKDLKIKLDLFIKDSLSVTAQLKSNDILEQTVVKVKAQFDKRRAFYQRLIDRKAFIKTEKQALDDRKNVILDINNPACPLCEQMLTLKRKQFLTSMLLKSEQLLDKRLTRINDLIKKLKAILLDQHEQINVLDRDFNAYNQLKIKFNDINKKVEEIKLLLTEQLKDFSELEKSGQALVLSLEKERTLLLQHEANRLTYLAKDEELVLLNKQILAEESEVEQINRKLVGYEQLQNELKAVGTAIQEFDQFKKEYESQCQRRRLITLIIKEVKELRRNTVLLSERLHKLNIDETLVQELEKKQLALRLEIDEVSKKKDALTLQIGRLDNELERYSRLKADGISRKSKVALLDKEIEDYQFLSTAFSKNGIQALLIEDAIPEVEAEANRILSKLTDNQAQVFIESLKDLKSGGVKETMEIQISDSYGIRPYEMYSGGEAFRVDFAIRIAISKLLAHRAGTSLRTLIIDEGFGSQDEESLARVMSLILSIREDFSKIIVVSHLPEFKDNFPIHFMVDKGPDGSRVTVEARG